MVPRIVLLPGTEWGVTYLRNTILYQAFVFVLYNFYSHVNLGRCFHAYLTKDATWPESEGGDRGYWQHPAPSPPTPALFYSCLVRLAHEQCSVTLGQWANTAANSSTDARLLVGTHISALVPLG